MDDNAPITDVCNCQIDRRNIKKKAQYRILFFPSLMQLVGHDVDDLIDRKRRKYFFNEMELKKVVKY